MSTDASVVICTYSLERWTGVRRAVRSVLAQRRMVSEVVVVVDHNPELLHRARACWPHSAALARCGRSVPVHVVANAGARGLSGARNTGVDVARSEIIAFLDDDAEADGCWAERLLVAYSHDGVVACGGAVIPVMSAPRPLWWPAEFDWVVGCSYVGLPTRRAVVRNLIGANMSVRRAAILDVGGFQDGIGRIGSVPFGDEETDLFIRLRQRRRDARIVYEPAAVVSHAVPSDRLSWRYFKSRCYAEGLSKAKVAQRVGSERALAAERSYALTVLPRGMARALLGVCRGEPTAAVKALAIAAGLAVTTVGYLHGRLAGPRTPRKGADLRSRHRLDPMATTTLALMATTVTTSGLGMVFWGLASRLYSPDQLGEDAALISAMMLLSIISQLNLGMGIPRLLPQVPAQRWRPVLACYAVTAAVALLVTGCFVTLAPRTSGRFAFLDGTLALGLVGAVVLWNVFALQDAVFTATRWAAIVPVENGLFGALKILLLVWLAHQLPEHGIFVAWVLAMGLLLVPTNGLLFSRLVRTKQRPVDRQPSTVLPLTDRSRIARYLLTDYGAALLSHGYNALLPLLVIAVLGGAMNAYFYVAFLIAAAIGTLAQSLSTALVVEGAHHESDLSALATRSLLRYVKFVAPGVGVLVACASLLLRPFGAAYVEHGSTPLRLLLAGTMPQAVVTLYLGVQRVRAQVGHVLVVEAGTVVLITVGAIVGMSWLGLTGVGLAWLFGHSAMAVLVIPGLRTATRGSEPSPTRIAA